MTYTYDPTQIKKYGKDQMRFELGDTFIGGGAGSCALSDEEYTALLEGLDTARKNVWRFAKLAALEAILFKLSYMVDTKIDVLWYEFGERAERWQKLYEQLKKQYIASMSVPTMDERAAQKPPYFHTGIDDNIRARLMNLNTLPFKNMNT